MRAPSYRTLRVWQRNRDVFFKLWRSEVPGFFAEPIAILLAMGAGLGAYVVVHTLNLMGKGSVVFPVVLLPLVGGLAGLVFGVLFGYVTTRRAGTTFALISLGVGEMVFACVLMFPGFFGGEAGVALAQHLDRQRRDDGAADPNDRRNPAHDAIDIRRKHEGAAADRGGDEAGDLELGEISAANADGGTGKPRKSRKRAVPEADTE